MFRVKSERKRRAGRKEGARAGNEPKGEERCVDLTND